jgi:hypothetical protein
MLQTIAKFVIIGILILSGIDVSTDRSTNADEKINYYTFAFEKDNFLAIVAGGNKRDRSAYLTVFEVLKPDHRLRRLHQTKLLNGCSPKSFALCGSGRFFLTMNEWKDPRISKYALVIYDLVRREHTAYRLKEFLPESEANATETVHWHWGRYYSDRFNPDTMEFYINDTNKEDSPRHECPFIVVDLPTRKVRLESPRKENQNPFIQSRLATGWNHSDGNDDELSEKVDGPPKMVPKLLRYGIWEDSKVEVKAYTYRLNLETDEYHLVPNEEWIEYEPHVSCTETHVEDP